MTHIPDNSREAEQSVLGALMIDAESNRSVIEQLTEEHFKWGEHKAILKAVQHLYGRSLDINVLTVDDYLTAIGAPEACDMAYINMLAEETRGIAGREVWSYFQILIERMQRRRILNAAAQVTDAAQTIVEIESVIEESQRALSGLTDPSAAGTTTMKDAVRRACAGIEERFYRKSGTLLGVPTGLTDLDELTMGLQPGLHILAARPGAGKTILAMQVAIATAQEGKNAAVFSLEMEDQQLAERSISTVSGLHYSKIRDPKKMQSDDDWQALTRGAGILAELPIEFFERSETNVTKIRSNIRQWHRTTPNAGIVVIDYLQLFQFSGGRNDNRTVMVGDATRALKVLSKELKLPILLLSQLNRSLENRPNKRPINSDLRDSGNIEQDADSIFFIYRDDMYNDDSDRKGIAEILCGKGRNFEPRTTFVAAQLDRQRFMDLAPEWQPPEQPQRIYKKGEL